MDEADIRRKVPDLGAKSFTDFVGVQSELLRKGGQSRTARAYCTARNRLLDFTGGDISLEAISDSLMKRFEEHLKEEGLQPNTISFYMRNLRALYHKAVDAGLITRQAKNPFARTYTGVAPTLKRALSAEKMQELNLLATAGRPQKGERRREEGELRTKSEELRVDAEQRVGASCGRRNENVRESLLLFLFAFHACGMSFVDLCYLRKSYVKEGEIHYHRKKTGGKLVVPITAPMREILGYFASFTSSSSPYLFPMLKGESAERDRKDYENALNRQNRLLKQVGKLAGLDRALSTHVARHSWATIAHGQQKPLAMISQALGHRDEKVTGIYLDSFQPSAIHRMSEEISELISRMVG